MYHVRMQQTTKMQKHIMYHAHGRRCTVTCTKNIVQKDLLHVPVQNEQEQRVQKKICLYLVGGRCTKVYKKNTCTSRKGKKRCTKAHVPAEKNATTYQLAQDQQNTMYHISAKTPTDCKKKNAHRPQQNIMYPTVPTGKNEQARLDSKN